MSCVHSELLSLCWAIVVPKLAQALPCFLFLFPVNTANHTNLAIEPILAGQIGKAALLQLSLPGTGPP
jgi:hypothetical protein